MSQRFIRCSHCGLPHAEGQAVCPATGRPIARPGRTAAGSSSSPAHSKDAPPAAARAHEARTRAEEEPANPLPRTRRQLIGKRIGDKYVVRSVLGQGGMGTVFEAEHLAIGRMVAVKVLHPNQAKKKDAVKRFHHEARAAGAIGHPNICEVYDLGTLDDGSPYLVMEKLVGETLADRIANEGGLPIDDVVDVVTQVLSGLVAAHEKRIVHRDIKPENVFLTRRVGCPPVAKLLDFGVSKMMPSVLTGERDEELDLTRTGMVMGTPYYMSPEQARGDRNLDARVDLYACGVILYEALTGRRPFTAANYNALLIQILTGFPRPAKELRPTLPNGYVQCIEKAMARAREDRYQTAAEFQASLVSLRERERRAIKPLTAPREPPRPAPRPSSPRRVANTPSSVEVEIPITVGTGEHPIPDDSHPPYHADSFDDATEVQRPEFVRSKRAPFPPSPDDAHTTQKSGPELDALLAQLPRDPLMDEQDATDVRPPRSRRRSGAKGKAPSPDDTVKMEGELGLDEPRGRKR